MLLLEAPTSIWGMGRVAIIWESFAVVLVTRNVTGCLLQFGMHGWQSDDWFTMNITHWSLPSWECVFLNWSLSTCSCCKMLHLSPDICRALPILFWGLCFFFAVRGLGWWRCRYFFFLLLKKRSFSCFLVSNTVQIFKFWFLLSYLSGSCEC